MSTGKYQRVDPGQRWLITLQMPRNAQPNGTDTAIAGNVRIAATGCQERCRIHERATNDHVNRNGAAGVSAEPPSEL